MKAEVHGKGHYSLVQFSNKQGKASRGSASWLSERKSLVVRFPMMPGAALPAEMAMLRVGESATKVGELKTLTV